MPLLALGQASATDSGAPFPDTDSEAWKALFAVDVAEVPLGQAPFDIGNGVRFETALIGHVAGFNVGYINLGVTVTDRGYRVDYKMVQQGVARWFSDGQAEAVAAGLFDDQANITTSYYLNHDYDGDDEQQRTELYHEAGSRRYHLWALPEYTFRQAVSEEEALGAVDPLAAIVALTFTPTGEGQHPCDRSVPVLDGKRRFDLVMVPDGTEKIRQRGPGRFEGQAIKCKLEQRKVAGYKENNRGDIEGDIWVYFVEVPEKFRTPVLRYAPVRISGRQGILGASLHAKRPRFIEADGSVTPIG